MKLNNNKKEEEEDIDDWCSIDSSFRGFSPFDCDNIGLEIEIFDPW